MPNFEKIDWCTIMGNFMTFQTCPGSDISILFDSVPLNLKGNSSLSFIQDVNSTSVQIVS
jgi:hypothetical protein